MGHRAGLGAPTSAWSSCGAGRAGSVWAAHGVVQAPEEIHSLLAVGRQRRERAMPALGVLAEREAVLSLPCPIQAALPHVLCACPTTSEQRPSLCPTDLCLARGEQDTGSAPELTLGLPVELDARVASTVRALQDDMRRVLERLSELETLASAQVHAKPRREPPRAEAGWQGRDSLIWCTPSRQGLAPVPANKQPGVAQVRRDLGVW